MNEDSVPKADRINFGETKGCMLASPRGAKPIRKKGFHRALKRGEIWAHMDAAHKRMMEDVCRSMYGMTRVIKEPE